MVSSFLVAAGFLAADRAGAGIAPHVALLISVAVTTVVWVVVALVAPPTDRATLVAFYRRVRPAGPGWGAVRAEAGVGPSPDSLAHSLLAWVLGCVLIYAALFGAGTVLYGRWPQAAFWGVAFVASGAGLAALVPRVWGRTS